MGSGAVQHLVTDENIHVGFDRASKMWWAVGRHGSYGGDRSCARAIHIAQDAAASGFTKVKVIVHNTKGKVVRDRGSGVEVR